MPYFAGLKIVECTAMRNSTMSINSTRVEKNTASPSSISDLEDLYRDQHGPLADRVRQVAGVSAEQQEGRYEHRAREREVQAARCRRDLDRPHGDDDLIKVVVEGAQELRPQERLETAPLQKIAETVLHRRCY